MKTENYKKAINNIHNVVGQSLINRIPTLDHIMNVENMSATDKIWYEAYKKYGNRNHTWQDFKNIFYGDLAVMQKTVKYWKTWDEINDLLSQADVLRTEVRSLLEKYGIQSIDEKKVEEYNQYKKLHPDLITLYEKYSAVDNMARANYSTFNPRVAQLEQEFETKSNALLPDDEKAKIDLITEYIKKMDEYVDLENGDFVIGERIEKYRNIILNDPLILQKTQNFDNLSGADKVALARMILDKSAKNTGTPVGWVIHDDAPDGPHRLKDNQAGGYCRECEQFLFKSDTHNFSDLFNFLRTLAHEDAHRIDYYNADCGIVGTQLMEFVKNNYLNNSKIDEELYTKWATEQSSYYLDNTVGAALVYAIHHQNY